jgi:hypothetical protein
MAYTDYSVIEGKTFIIYIKKNPTVRGRKNPISHFSRIKNPKLLYLYIAVAL